MASFLFFALCSSAAGAGGARHERAPHRKRPHNRTQPPVTAGPAGTLHATSHTCITQTGAEGAFPRPPLHGGELAGQRRHRRRRPASPDGPFALPPLSSRRWHSCVHLLRTAGATGRLHSPTAAGRQANIMRGTDHCPVPYRYPLCSWPPLHTPLWTPARARGARTRTNSLEHSPLTRRARW